MVNEKAGAKTSHSENLFELCSERADFKVPVHCAPIVRVRSSPQARAARDDSFAVSVLRMTFFLLHLVFVRHFLKAQ